MKNFGCVLVYLRKEIKKPLNQAKDPEVKERTYDAYYFICASELQDQVISIQENRTRTYFYNSYATKKTFFFNNLGSFHYSIYE
jgi:hypothetical protein